MRQPLVSAIAILMYVSPVSWSVPLEIAIPELPLSNPNITEPEQLRFQIQATIDQPSAPQSLLRAAHVVDPMAVELNPFELATLTRSDLIEVDTPDGLRTLEIDELQNRTPHISILKGRLMNSPRSHVLITRVNDAVAGSITDHESGDNTNCATVKMDATGCIVRILAAMPSVADLLPRHPNLKNNAC
jgi:hypothetical protein